jgi:hypothetical protein
VPTNQLSFVPGDRIACAWTYARARHSGTTPPSCAIFVIRTLTGCFFCLDSVRWPSNEHSALTDSAEVLIILFYSTEEA